MSVPSEGCANVHSIGQAEELVGIGRGGELGPFDRYARWGSRSRRHPSDVHVVRPWEPIDPQVCRADGDSFTSIARARRDCSQACRCLAACDSERGNMYSRYIVYSIILIVDSEAVPPMLSPKCHLTILSTSCVAGSFATGLQSPSLRRTIFRACRALCSPSKR